MHDREGVIKYQLDHDQTALPCETSIGELNAWRTLLHRLALIGQIPDKYDGLGFGNISRRLAPDSEQFLISGTQTGRLPSLALRHYALVIEASPEQNRIRSRGLTPPSSEALTHAGVYRQDPSVQAVIHVHSSELWRNTLDLSLPHTAANIPYGTPAMAEAVAELFASGQLESLRLFSMLGHEDGIVAFGSSMEAAATCLIAHLAKALTVEQTRQAL